MRTSLAAAALIACTFGCGDDIVPSSSDAGDEPPVGQLCVNLDCVPCAQGEKCAADGEPIAGTCCVPGDNIVKIGFGRAQEAVDVEADETHAVVCGGFGGAIHDVRDPANPRFIRQVTDRCQRAQLGPVLPSGERVVWLAHHGDSWVPEPQLSTFHIADTSAREVHIAQTPGVLFEGLRLHRDHLYAAAHRGGVRVYSLDDEFAFPRFESALAGFDNAWKIDSEGDYLYVADGEGGLKVVDVTVPLAPTIVQTAATTTHARDVDVHGGRVYVALGGGGIDIFDIGDAGLVTPVVNLPIRGSAQGVSVTDELVAVAAWSHVALYDTESMALLGTERTRPHIEFEQDLGVAVVGERLFVAEWEGMHVFEYRQGLVAPDLWIDDLVMSFAPDTADARAVVVRNLGPLELLVTDIQVESPGQPSAFNISDGNLAIESGGADFFELWYAPPAPPADGSLVLTTNDPDLDGGALSIPLVTSATSRLDVGDKLGNEFRFFDPSGANQLSGLEGKVIVLAYFALF